MKKRKLARLFAGVLALLTFISYSTNFVTLAEEVTEESVASQIAEPAPESAGTQVEDTQGKNYKADTKTYVYEDAQVLVRATVSQEGILPEDASLKVSLVTDAQQLEQAGNLLQGEADRLATNLIDFMVYDISFYQGEEEIEPAGNVDITIEQRSEETLACASNQDTMVKVFHQKDDNQLEDVAGDVRTNAQDGIQQVNLSSGSFSPFPVATFGNEVSGAQIQENSVSAQLQTQAAALLSASDPQEDSLTLNKTASYDNDKDQATISLEAYATGKVTQVTNKIPTDIVLVLDQSGSMSHTISNTIYTAKTGIYEGKYYYDKTYYIQVNGEYQEVHYHNFGDRRNPQYRWYYGTAHWYQIVYPYTTATGRSDGKNPAYQFYSQETTSITKLEALKNAVNAFIEAVKKDSINRDVDNRIAIVGFAGYHNPNNYVNDELFIGGTSYGYKDTYLNSDYSQDYTDNSGVQRRGIANQYKNAFQIVARNGVVNTNLTDSVNALTAYGATNAHDGMDMANEILKANRNSYGTDENGNPIRNKAIIMFTDGEPTGIQFGNSFDSEVAKKAIANAYISKNTYGATVYAAGIVEALDPTQNPASGDISNMNRYMQYLSSNYPKARALDEPGTGGDYTAGYFLSATDAASLTEIFQNISSAIGGTSSTLGSSTFLKDYIADSFDATKITNSDVKVYTSDYLGNGAWGSKKALTNPQIMIDAENQTVSVSNYDYSGNYILEQDPSTGKPRGRKLIVEITAPVIDGFIGGNAVPTNTSSAGIYVEDTMVEAFPEPEVDVNLQYDYDTRPASIYVADAWEQVELFFDNPSQAGIQYQIDNQWYTIDGKRNAYSNISYEVKDSKGNVVGIYNIPAGETTGAWDKKQWIDTTGLTKDTQYMICGKITPSIQKDNGVADLNLQGKQAVLHVFCPAIGVTDTRVFYGDTTDLQQRINAPVIWKCQDNQAERPVAAEPSLVYEYTVAGDSEPLSGDMTRYMPDKDTDIKLSVWKKGVDITKFTTITNESGGRDAKHDFTIYVDKGTLIISKTIDQQYTHVKTVNANQSFIYKINQYEVKEDGSKGNLIATFYETLNFVANEGDTTKSTASITGLKKGYYEVTEETAWSQKYQLTAIADNYGASNDGQLYINSDGITHGTVTFTNHINTAWKWMSDVAAVTNQFVK